MSLQSSLWMRSTASVSIDWRYIGSLLRMFYFIWYAPIPLNAEIPVNNSWSKQPKLHQSLASLKSLCKITSGAAMCGVVFFLKNDSSLLSMVEYWWADKPKSVILARPYLEITMFSVFRSLNMIFYSCRNSSPKRIHAP